MKRMVIKEFNKSIYALDIMLYTVISVIGYLLIEVSSVATIRLYEYIISIFFICGFFSLLAYFLNRREDDYEFLFLGLINVFVSCFILFNSKNSDVNFIVSNSLLFYSLAYFLNKVIHVYKLFKKRSLNFIPKCAVMVLIVALSLIATLYVYNKIEVALVIYGYYFMGFGLLSIIEVLLIILINGKTIRKRMFEFLDYKEEKSVKREVSVPKKIKSVTGKRIKAKKVNEEIIEETVQEKPKKKKKKKVKKDNK